jgi:hypothetical protein
MYYIALNHYITDVDQQQQLTCPGLTVFCLIAKSVAFPTFDSLLLLLLLAQRVESLTQRLRRYWGWIVERIVKRRCPPPPPLRAQRFAWKLPAACAASPANSSTPTNMRPVPRTAG